MLGLGPRPISGACQGFTQDLPLYLIPHGIDFRVWDQEDTSPYGSGIHAVSVGSMLFDESFVVSAAYLFPEVQFHIIAREEPAVRFRARTFMFTGDEIHRNGEVH